MLWSGLLASLSFASKATSRPAFDLSYLILSNLMILHNFELTETYKLALEGRDGMGVWERKDGLGRTNNTIIYEVATGI